MGRVNESKKPRAILGGNKDISIKKTDSPTHRDRNGGRQLTYRDFLDWRVILHVSAILFLSFATSFVFINTGYSWQQYKRGYFPRSSWSVLEEMGLIGDSRLLAGGQRGPGQLVVNTSLYFW